LLYFISFVNACFVKFGLFEYTAHMSMVYGISPLFFMF